MDRYLKRETSSVYVMLGSACNLRCRYCLQHPLAGEGLPREADPEVYAFISELAEANPGLHIVFYGGEPLLYFADIEALAAACGNLNYSVITNGARLTDGMADFFNEHGFGVAVSWDGSASAATRGFDFFGVPELRKRGLRLERLCLTGVVSAAAYPAVLLDDFQRVADDYAQIHGRYPGINLDEVMDAGIADRSLLDIDYGRVEGELRGLTLLYLDDLLNRRGASVQAAYIDSIVRAAKRFYVDDGGAWKSRTVRCGNGLTTLNVDLRGNLYPCHNSRLKAGTIRSGFFDYLQNVLAGDDTERYREGCLRCSALPVCRGGCKLVSAEAREAGYCKLKRAVFGTVLKTLEENGGLILKGAMANGDSSEGTDQDARRPSAG